MPVHTAMFKENERTLILRIALPSMIAMIASGFCSLLDALLLGRLGTQAAAAVSISFPILTMIQTIGFTLGMGAGSFVSRSLGANSRKPALQAASTAFFLALIISSILCAAGFVFASPLSRLLGAGDDVLSPAARYMRFVLASGPLLCMNLMTSSLLRALGRAIPNMAAFLTGALAGSLLQFILIDRLSLGLTGSGIAMLVRETVTLLILMIAICRSDKHIRPRPGLFTPSHTVLKDIMRSGLPTLLRQGLMSLSGAMLSRISASFGSAALAGMGLCVRLLSLISSAVIGFGQGFQPVCGFAFGAGDMQRIRRAYQFCMRCIVLSLLALGAFLFYLAPSLLNPFSAEPSAAEFAQKALRIQSIVLFAQGAVIMMNMLTQAMGLTIRASVIATSRQGFVLIPLLLILPRLFGETGLLLSQSISDLLSLLLCFLLSRRCLPAAGRFIHSSCEPCGCSRAQTASR